MKKVIFTSIVLAGLAATEAEAKIWRVNNQGYGADYAQINEAVTDPNVLAGDTLHVEGSGTVYNYAVVTKRLVIIGPGYFLTDNPKVTNNGISAQVNFVDFNNGSANSQLIGMSVNNTISIANNNNNITLKRNKIKNQINLGFGLSNITIIQNFFENTSSSTSSVFSPLGGDFVTNFTFNNNIVQRPLKLYDNTASLFLECNNNVFDLAVVPTSEFSLQFYAASFKNNILVNNTATVKINGITNFSTTPNAAVSHNIGTSAAVHFGTANNNLVVSNINTIWNIATTASPDGKYQLATTSVASGSGNGGVDRGAFGALAPSNKYVLSGLAPIPVIYEVSTSGVATPSTGLNVTIKARTIE